MLSFKRFSIFALLLSLLVITGFAYFKLPVSNLFLILLFIFLSYFLVCIIASFNICWGFYVKAICKGRQSRNNTIFITFDDGPDRCETPLILDVLKKHNVKASFFVIGIKARQDLELLKRMNNERHVIGNHSYDHANHFPFRGRRTVEKEIEKTQCIINSVTAGNVLFFRPPFGVTNPIIASVVKKMGLVTVGWSLRSFDTVIRSKEKMLDRLLKRTHNGAIVLFHDRIKGMHFVLDKYIQALKNQQYRFETLDKFKASSNV